MRLRAGERAAGTRAKRREDDDADAGGFLALALFAARQNESDRVSRNLPRRLRRAPASAPVGPPARPRRNGERGARK